MKKGKLKVKDLIMAFVAFSFYPSAISDCESFYRRIENVYVFTKGVDDNRVIPFFNQKSTVGRASPPKFIPIQKT